MPPEAKPIPDSVEITKYFAKFYPSLIPESHDSEIKELLAKLHGINFYSVTFAGRPQTQENAKRHLESLLSTDISERYREALKYKIQRYVKPRTWHSISGVCRC